MYIIITLTLVLIFFSSVDHLRSDFLPNGSYMSRERTCMINGIFIWIVFMSHMRGYFVAFPEYDYPIAKSIGYLGQCCVATFFFYSGYGIMSSIQSKGGVYAVKLVCKRFPMLLLHMTIAVSLFWGVQSLYGNGYEWAKLLLSFVGWDSLGNSNWFIFVSLISYLIIAFSYVIGRRLGHNFIVFLASLLFILLICFLCLMGKGFWWYDSCLCIPAGMLFFIWRSQLEILIAKLRCPVWICGLLLIAAALILYIRLCKWAYLNNFSTILFAFGITVLFSCVELKRKPVFLCWCGGGTALFSLFIFQRLPMLIGAREHWQIDMPFLYQLFCVVVTILLAVLGSLLFRLIDGLIFKNK